MNAPNNINANPGTIQQVTSGANGAGNHNRNRFDT